MNTTLQENLNTFIEHIESTNDTVPMTFFLMKPHHDKLVQKYNTFKEEKVKSIKDEKGDDTVEMDPEDILYFEHLRNNLLTSALSFKIIPESLFVSMVSAYDSFLNNFLKILFKIKPTILYTSDRSLTFNQLFAIGSIEEAMEYLVEKEIDTVLRKSHADHFKYLETKLAMTLTKGLPAWSEFIELTERRNLLVHTGGIVSHQYLDKCKEAGFDTKELKVGDRLEIEPDYLHQSHNILFEIAVKLTHTIWRKLLPEDLETADNELLEVAYNKLMTRNYELSDVLLEFAMKQNKHFDEIMKNMFIINAALSQHLQNNKKEANKILDQKDWSSTKDMFQLAVNVIRENHEEVYKYMRRIGTNDELVKKTSYKEWPLFRGIRQQGEFREVFQEIFNEEFKVVRLPIKKADELIIRDFIERKKKKDKEQEKLDELSLLDTSTESNSEPQD